MTSFCGWHVGGELLLHMVPSLAKEQIEHAKHYGLGIVLVERSETREIEK
jgi:hypothetical protein